MIKVYPNESSENVSSNLGFLTGSCADPEGKGEAKVHIP